jgi:hypothetical protein
MEVTVATVIVVLVVAVLAVAILYPRRYRRIDAGASSDGSMVTEGERNSRAALRAAGRNKDWSDSPDSSDSSGGGSGGDGGGGGGD